MSYDQSDPASGKKRRKRVFNSNIDEDISSNGYETSKKAANGSGEPSSNPPAPTRRLFGSSPPLRSEVDRIIRDEALPSKLRIPFLKAAQRLGSVDKLPCNCNDKGKVKTLYLSPVRQTSKDVPVRVTRKRIVCKPKDNTRHEWDCNELENIKEALKGKTESKRIDGGSYE